MRIDVDATKRRFLTVSHLAGGEMMWFTKDLLAEISDDEHTTLRRDLLELYTPYSGRVRHTPCGQFWVHRDRILARPLAFYQRLYNALSDASHPLLSRFAAAEGYPSRMLHVFFVEGYWHYIFGEGEDYGDVPYSRYEQMPFVALGSDGSKLLVQSQNEEVPIQRRSSEDFNFPPLRLTFGGLKVHLRKQQLQRSVRRGGSVSSIGGSNSSGGMSSFVAPLTALSPIDQRTPRQLLGKLVHGSCDCTARRAKGRPTESCRRAADGAIRLLLRIGELQRLNESNDFCAALRATDVLADIEAKPERMTRVRSLQWRCFGGTGGARDYALTALVSCMLRRSAIP